MMTLPVVSAFRSTLKLSFIYSINEQAAYDELTGEMTELKARFFSEMAQAGHDAADQRVQFDARMALAARDSACRKASFHNQLARAALEAADMKVCVVGAAHLSCT